MLLRGSTVTLVLGGWSTRIALLVVLRLCSVTRLLWRRGSIAYCAIGPIAIAAPVGLCPIGRCLRCGGLGLV